MEQVKPPGKLRFVVVWGVLLWGGPVALAITLFNRYADHRIETPSEIIGRFVIFIGGGFLYGLSLWSRRGTLRPANPTKAGSILRFVVFVGLMAGLVYVLWAMARH